MVISEFVFERAKVGKPDEILELNSSEFEETIIIIKRKFSIEFLLIKT